MRMFRLYHSFPIVAALAAGMAACGGDGSSEVTQVSQERATVVADPSKLPDCTGDNEGELFFVNDENAMRVCVDGTWKASSDSDNDLSCKTEELKDKSGLKIVCNGDSVGVVKNGANGENGVSSEGCTVAAQTDSTVTIDCGKETTTIPLGGKTLTKDDDPERQETSLDSLVGVTQKGPFLKGSTVYLYELESGRTLKQTNGNFTSNILSDDGRYRFLARDLVSQYAMLVVDGYYRNEVTGKVSDNTIRLKAFTDLSKHTSANVNLLTHLEFERVYYLVTKMKKKLYQAKAQAQGEILDIFHIKLKDKTDAEEMNVFGDGDANAALLAISILLQGDRTESDMMALLAEISNAIADKAEWKNSTSKSQIALWAAVADGQGRLDSISNHVKGWGLGGGKVPPFEKYVRNFYGQETGLGACGVDNPLGTKKTLKSGSDTFIFVCEDAEKGWWRLLTKLDLDTLGWGHDFEEGDVRNGQVNTNLTYVYENGAWRHGTALDSILGLSCIQARKDSLLKASAVDFYKCVGDTAVSFEESRWTSVWRQATNIELDRIYWEEKKNERGLLLKGPYTGRALVWDNGKLREPILVEQKLGRACINEMYGTIDTLLNSLAYTCSDTGWSQIGTFKDARDGKIYKGVMIGEQTWMAENLNYEFGYDNGNYSNGTYYETRCTSWGGSSDDCAATGRLYRWSAVMDSAGLVKRNPANKCGYGQNCTAQAPVRGVCPAGWHLPGKEEWNVLVKEAGGVSMAGMVLKSKTGWANRGREGIDSYSFSVKPGSIWENQFMTCSNLIDDVLAFWTATEASQSMAYNAAFTSNDAVSVSSYGKDCGYYVRCVKD